MNCCVWGHEQRVQAGGLQQVRRVGRHQAVVRLLDLLRRPGEFAHATDVDGKNLPYGSCHRLASFQVRRTLPRTSPCS